MGKEMEKYKRTKKLGEGTYGVVYKAENIFTGEEVALKAIRLESEEEGVPCTAIREISLLKELDHPNVVRLIEIIHDVDKLTLVFEFCDQDLKQHLDAHFGILDNTKIKFFLYQLLKGVEYCHKRRVLHRDLKPQNLLISKKDNTLKLADFGLARAFTVPVRNYSPEVVTLWYRAPEVLMGFKNYSTPIDMWSIGCIFAEMKNGKPLFTGKTTEQQLQSIFKGLGTPSVEDYPKIVELPGWSEDFPQYPGKSLQILVPGLDEDGYDLLGKLLQYDPAKRPSATEAINHPYLATVKSTDQQKKK
uniref:cyclin-dependent kinase n=1 Tax=Arcella intermedia TaxID=1963864 RepID=A0A6B2LBW3_9EUKA